MKLKPHVQTLLPVLDLVLSSVQAHFEADGVLKRRANSSPPFSGLSVKESFALEPIQISRLLKRRVNSSPPFNPSLPRYSLVVSPSPIQKQRVYRRDEQTQAPLSTLNGRENLLETLQGPPPESASVPFRSLSTLPPYSRKPSPFGPRMSICAKGVSRGVHNIAFSLSPDRFRAFDLFFLHIFDLWWVP